MKDFNYLFLLILTLFTLLKLSLNSNSTINPIILNFYTKVSNNDNFIEANYKSYLYSRINFGSNKQTVEMRLLLNNLYTYITNKSEISPLYNTYTYDNTTSTSYEHITFIPAFSSDDYNLSSISKESLYTDNGILENFTFYYTFLFKSNLDVPAGSIGFHIIQPMYTRYNTNFIDQLKKNNLISGYGLTINFTSRDEGNLIIGNDFGEIDENYKKYNNTIISIGYIYNQEKWGFNFYSVLVGKNILTNSNVAIFGLDTDFIIGTDEYSKIIYEIFFKNLIIEKKKCIFENIIDQNYYKIIKCEKDTKINNFPKLIFNIGNYGPSFNFSFNYKDLFELKDNYYYFKIVFIMNSTDNINFTWKFGRIFFRKFIVTLNKDKKTIKFYKKIGDNEDEDENEDNEKKSQRETLFNLLDIILIIILFGICIILIIVIFKYCGLNKKLKNKERKNVLLDEDDDYIDITKTEKLTATINES